MSSVLSTGTMDQIERVVIKERLDALKWNRTHTAKSLGIGIRTLQRKMKSFDLLAEEPAKAVAEAESTEGANAEG